MKTLKEFLTEGILDIEDNIENLTRESLIEDFIKENYNTPAKIQIKKNGNKHIVSTNGYVEVKNKNITALTNDLFEWGIVGDHFDCDDCISLKSLEGAPKEVEGNFSCSGCTSLKDLEGAPKEVGWNFDCSRCASLKDLTGAPEKVKHNFDCQRCTSLESLNGAPEKVEGDFYCYNCISLKSLEGAPKEVGRSFNCSKCTSLKDLTRAPKKVGMFFNCSNCGKQFTEEDVRAVCDVKGRITV